MSWRTKAESAIRRWNLLGLDQKVLASLARVHPTVITHVRDYPDFTIKEATAQRIVAEVEAEEAKRIASLGMSVFAYCHGSTVPTVADDLKLVEEVRRGLADPTLDVRLPQDAGAAILELTRSSNATQKARMFLIVLSPAESDDEKRALAHELGHLRAAILKDLQPPDAPPKSAF